MNDESIRIRARVRLLPTSESGRTVPIRGSYRPNHNFFDPENINMTIGFLDLPEGTDLHPGESIELPITLWNWPGLKGQIYPGREWRIQEGGRLVGIGTVLEVLPAAK
jgi:elongation factor Tu